MTMRTTATQVHDFLLPLFPQLVGVSGPMPDGWMAADGTKWKIDPAPPPSVTAALAAFTPPSPSSSPGTPGQQPLTFLQFEALFTPAEQNAIYTAALSNPVMLQWVTRAASSPLTMGTAEIEQGIAFLQSLNILTPARAAAVAAGQAPS